MLRRRVGAHPNIVRALYVDDANPRALVLLEKADGDFYDLFDGRERNALEKMR